MFCCNPSPDRVIESKPSYIGWLELPGKKIWRVSGGFAPQPVSAWPGFVLDEAGSAEQFRQDGDVTAKDSEERVWNNKTTVSADGGPDRNAFRPPRARAALALSLEAIHLSLWIAVT